MRCSTESEPKEADGALSRAGVLLRLLTPLSAGAAAAAIMAWWCCCCA